MDPLDMFADAIRANLRTAMGTVFEKHIRLQPSPTNSC